MHNSSLNHTYRLVWNDSTGTYVAVAETTRGRGKASRSGKTLNALVTVAVGALLACSGTGLVAQTMDDGNGGTGRFVESGTLSLSNTTITNFSTVGGNGSGGGAGLGGALFINEGATVILNNVNFTGNTAKGGTGGLGTVGGSINSRGSVGTAGTVGADGSNAPPGFAFANGGNGGVGYNALNGGDANNGVGGKGGNGGNGTEGLPVTADTIQAIAQGVFDAAMIAWDVTTLIKDGTMAGTYTAIAAQFTSAAALAATQAMGGLGAGYVISGLGAPFTTLAATYTALAAGETAALASHDALRLAADTAMLAANTAYATAMHVTGLQIGTMGVGGDGGAGGDGGKGSAFYGGGQGGQGGNGGDAYIDSGAFAGVGGDGGAGGAGGFGAGGGAGGDGGTAGTKSGGTSVWSGNISPDGGAGAGGVAGFGAGSGASGSDGGGAGGSGYGGAIFVRKGGSLTMNGTANFEQNAVLGGDGQAESGSALAGAPGSALGTDLFMMKGSTVVLAPGGNNIITFNGTIADDSGIAGVADGNGASLRVQDGLVIFNGANTYSGQSQIAAGGVLQAMDGTGIATNSNINLMGGVLQTNGLFNRFVGTSSPRIQWTGDGGFAAQGGALEVSLSSKQALTWGTSSFVPSGNTLLFGSATATDSVTFNNAINLNNATRTILVTANDAALSGVEANIDTAILNGVLSNGGLVVGDNSHNGILILNKSNTYTAGTTIYGGTLRESATGFLADSGFVTVDGANAVFDLGDSHEDTVGTVTLKAGATLLGSGTSKLSSTGTFELLDGTVNLDLGGDNIALNKTSDGTVTLNKANSYTGLTTVSAGKLNYGVDNAIASGAVTVNGATAELAMNTFNDTVGTVTLDGGGLISGPGNTSGTLTSTGSFEVMSGTVSAKLGGDTIALNKTTGGTVNLNNQNSYTGLTTVSAGKLNYGVNDAIASGAVTVNGATAVLELNTFNDSVGTVTLDGGGLISGTGSDSSNGILTSTGSFEVKDGTVGAKLGGDGIALNKTTGGTVNLNNQNTYTGLTTVSAGKLNYGVNDAIASGAVTVNGATAELAMNTFNDSVGTVTLDGGGLISGPGNTSGTLTSTGSFEVMSGTVSAKLGGDAIALNKTTGGTVNLNNENSYTGLTTVSAGKLNYGVDNAIASGAVTVNGATAELAMNTFNDSVGTVTLDGGGLISGPGNTSGTLTSTGSFEVMSGTVSAKLGGDAIALNKTSEGTVNLNNENSYTGLTTVSAGKLNYGVDNAIASGAVTVNGATAVLELNTFNDSVGTVTLDGGGLISGTGSDSTNGILTSTGTFEVKSGTVDAKLGGTNIVLNKTTDGTVNLNNQNTYTGLTTVSAGKLNYGVDNAIANGDVTVEGPTAELAMNTFNDTVGKVTLKQDGLISGPGTTSGTLTSTVSFELMSGTVSAKLGGDGINLNKTTSGTVNLTNDNIYTGVTQIDAGTVNLTGSLASPTVNVASGAILDNVNSGLAANAALTNAGTVNLGADDTIASFSNTGTLNIAGTTLTAATYALNNGSVINANLGTGIVTANGAVALNGTSAAATFNIDSGTTTLGSAERLLDTAAVTIAGNSHLVLGGAEKVGQLLGAGQVDLSAGGLTVDSGNFSGVLHSSNASFGLTKVSAGTLALSGTNTYTGLTQIDAGTVNLTGSLASTAVNVATGATLNNVNAGLITTVITTVDGSMVLGTSQQIGQLFGAGQVDLTTGTLTVDSGNFAGGLHGQNSAFGLTKVSSGTLTLSGSSSYVGNTQVNAGSLILSGTSAPNLSTSTAVTVANGATLVVNGDNTVASLTSSGAISGNMTLTAPIYNLNDGSQVSAKLGDVATGSTLNSNGAVTLSNTVAATTINVQTGTLTVAAPDILAHAATVDIANPATVSLTGGDQTIKTLNGGGSLTLNGNNLNVTNGGTYSGTTTTTGSLTKTGTGTLDLSGDNTFTQGIVVDAGTVTIAPGSTQTTSATSDTVVNNGSTLVNNGLITNSVVVNTGGMLMGSGTFTGNLTGNGTTSPGNSPGILTVAGNYVENGQLNIEVWGTGGPGIAVTGHDQVAVGGKTVLNATTSALNLIQTGSTFEPAKGDKFTIIQGAPGSISGSFATFTTGFTNDMILNRSTGQLIGTGLLTATTGSNILNALPGASSNLQSMVQGLMIGDHQYAGGDLLALLLTPGLTAADIAVISNLASPEAYAGLTDYAARATQNYADSAVNMTALAHTDTYAIFAGYTNVNTGSSSSVNQADYDLKSQGAVAGVRFTITPSASAGLFVGTDSGSVDATYTRGSSNGNVYGFFGQYLAGEANKLSITGSVSIADYTSEGTRGTAGTGIATPGLSRFKDVGSSATVTSLAIKYRAWEQPSYVIQPEIKLSHTDSHVNGFTETNANTMQALAIASQSASNFTAEAAVSARLQVNPKFKLDGRLGVSQTSGDGSRAVTANVVGETTSFSVRAPGMGNTALTIGMGASYRVTDKFTLSATYRNATASGAQSSNAFNINAALSF